MTRFEAGDARVRGTRYRTSGAGAPVVLIHGVGADLEMWEPLADRLAATRRVIRYDMQGHGESAKPKTPYSLGDFIAQLRRLAHGLGLDCFDLVGFSMGALVAQGFALAHPKRIGRLVLLNGVFDRSPAERAAIEARVKEVLFGGYAASIDAAIERWFTPGFAAAHPEAVASIRHRMEANDLISYAAAYAVFATADRDLAAHVGRISAPALVVTGADDRRSTPAMAKALAARLPSGRCHIIPNQRHMTPLEVPDRLAGMIDDFLADSLPVPARAAL